MLYMYLRANVLPRVTDAVRQEKPGKETAFAMMCLW